MKLFILMEMSWLLLMISAFVNSDVTSTRILNLNGTGEGDHALVDKCEVKCGISEDVQCNGDPFGDNEIICTCKDSNKKFVEMEKVCKVFCDPQKNSCKNGGKCIQQGDSYNCSCLEGTSGDFCELVQECKDPKFCGDRLLAKCYFNVTKKRADCVCYDERKTFDPVKKVCKRICGVNNNNCENEGTCVKSGNSSYCKCLNGTRGDLCEIVNECESNICGYSIKVKCYFDVLKGKAACKCLEEDSVFYEDQKACRKVCSAKNRCKNGGLCVNIGNYSFCSCLDGTSGDLCENVKDCYIFTCGQRSSCYFDLENRKAACRCKSKDEIYDKERKVCIRVCGKDNSCVNGGKCRKYGNYSLCTCPNGTSGDLCHIVDECQNSSLCGNKYGVQCYFNESKGKAACGCQYETQGFHPSRKVCQKQCDKMKNGCENGGTCVKYGNYSFCSCRKGTTGDFCKYVYDCSDVFFCGKSIYSTVCYFNQSTGKAACKCYDKEKVYNVEKKMCMRPCDAMKNDCQNGGTCARYGNYTFCSCRNGTTGEFCQDVSDCNRLYVCGYASDATCYFNQSTGKAACKCNVKEEDYNVEKKMCMRSCDAMKNHCQNGGTCVKSGNYSFCSCRNGTTGDFCQHVSDCKVFFVCGYTSDATCYFNQSTGKAACKCKDKEKVYNVEKKMCMIQECDKSQYCSANKDVKCIIDQVSGKPMCKCKDNIKQFDLITKECRRPCDAMKNHCQNGGTCVKYGNYSFCSCRNGTTGDFCQHVSDCKDLFVCGYSSGATCYFNQSTGKAACKCNDKEEFYNVEKKMCTILECDKRQYCSANKDVNCIIDKVSRKPICKCKDNIKQFDLITKECRRPCDAMKNDCQNGGTCERYGNYAFCSCRSGTTGEFCQHVSDCKDIFFCGYFSGATCYFNQSTGKAACKCNDKEKVYNEEEEMCMNINECEQASACPETTYCLNTRGSYSCHCKDGFKRKSPDSDPKVDGCKTLCDPNPCMNDAECITVGNHGFSCKCSNWYVGTFCNETGGTTAKPFSKDVKTFAIVGGVLAAQLLILLILGIVVCKLKKYKKNKEANAMIIQSSNRPQMTGIDNSNITSTE